MLTPMERPTHTPATPEAKSFTDSLMDADPLRSLFDLSKVEALRHEQQRAYDESLQGSAQQGYSPELSQYYAGRAVGQVVNGYIDAGGYSHDDPTYEKISEGLMGVSILNVPEEHWTAKFKDGSTTELDSSGRDLTRAAYEDISGKSYFELPTIREHTDEDKEQLVKMHEELNDYRETLAMLSAKRQGRVAGSGGEAYQEALQKYNTHMIALAELENAPVLEATLNQDPELDKEAKEQHVVKYLIEEQAKLRGATVEKLKNTKVGKVVEWMTRGNRAVRILKGIGVGVGAGALAAGIGLAAGAAGVAAIGAGVAGLATAAVRFGRGYAMADARGGRGMKIEVEEANVTDSLQESPATEENAGEPDYVKRIATLLGHDFETDTQKEQAKRRKSLAWGLGTLAVGGAIGTAITLGIDALATGGSPGNFLFGGHTAEATSGTPSVEDHSLSQEWYQEHQQILAEQQAAAAAEAAAREAAEQQAEQALNAQFYIQPGEGGIHFFSRLGLSRDQWYQVQDELFNRFPKEFYQSPGQAVRISAAGPLSDGAREYIKGAFGL